MNPGRFDKQLQLQTRTLTTSAGGSAVEVWANTRTLWAQVVEVSGSDSRKAEAHAVHTGIEVTTYYDATITAESHRLLWGSRVLDITEAPRMLGRSAHMVIECKERRSP